MSTAALLVVLVVFGAYLAYLTRTLRPVDRAPQVRAHHHEFIPYGHWRICSTCSGRIPARDDKPYNWAEVELGDIVDGEAAS